MTHQLKDKVRLLQEKAGTFSILYVEDNEELRTQMRVFLAKIFKKVEFAVDGEEGLYKYLKNHFDIVITDIVMPKMSGLELIRHIRQHNEEQEIIVISAYAEPGYLTECIRLDVTGYMIKPIEFDQVVKTLDHSINKLTVFRENEMYKTQLEALIERRTKKVLNLKEQLVDNYEHAIHSLVKMIEARDTYTGGHSERVAAYSRDIAKAMGYSKKECDLIYQAGILHDIGKIITPDAILLKPGILSEQEYALIKEHAKAGYDILIEIPMYKELANIVYSHHEHYNGSGYPRGLKGREIPVYARIMALADAFDAMTTSRIYKVRKTVPEAISELKKLSGIWYDPDVIAKGIDVLNRVNIDIVISQDPSSHIDDERFAYFYKDPLTHLYNQYYFDFIMQKNRDTNESLCLHVIYIKNFTAYNRQHGWNEGDVFLNKFGKYLMTEFSDFKIFRIFGDDFALLSNAHRALDVNKINATALLKDADLYCEHIYFDLEQSKISSYKDLQSSR